jgi:hypothetical protein
MGTQPIELTRRENVDGSDDEILAVLREIRDLQKAHMERYVEFTSRVMEQQKKSAQRAELDTAAALEEQQRVGKIANWSALLSPFATALMILVLAVVLFITKR